MKNYEVYITDDAGRRIDLLNNIAFLSLSRTTRGFGTVHLGIPLADFKVFPYFLPDRRIEVWRAPRHGATLREEGSFLLRKFNIYSREEDNVQIIEFWGRSPIDILRRASVTSTTLADYTKTDEIDDMMKDIVQDALITPAVSVPTGEMTVDGTDAQGPSITHSFYGQNVLDILSDLKDISFTKHAENDNNNRIYFDVVRGAALATGGFGYIFRTYSVLRGTDRTGGVVFSPENGNVKGPSYYEDHLDSFTQAEVVNLSTPAANGLATGLDATLSRWNTIVSAQQTSETSAAINDSKAFAVLQEGSAEKAFNADFLDSPGNINLGQPRSLYGVDWDLGDLLPVRYAGKDLTVEIKTVYVSIDEEGKENVVGLGELISVAPLIATPYDIDYLIIGGGGAGGAGDGSNNPGGGGGAGGYKTGTTSILSFTPYDVVVGAGGIGALTSPGGVGSVSSFNSISSEGGSGGGFESNGLGGNGSGGGGSGWFTTPDFTGGVGTVGQGHNGGKGDGQAGAANRAAGGGGGAGAVGANGVTTTSGNGGVGTASSITGASVTRAGGGGGGHNSGSTAGTGGTGGGGNGSNSGNGSNGTANRGGGGGGGRSDAVSGFKGGDGGTGVVILRIPTANYSGTVTGSVTVTVDGSFTVLTFTGNGTYTA